MPLPLPSNPPPRWLLPPEPLPPFSAEELRRFRLLELRCSQVIAAGLLGVNVETLRKWEQGVNPVSETAARLIELWRRSAGAEPASPQQ